MIYRVIFLLGATYITQVVDAQFFGNQLGRNYPNQPNHGLPNPSFVAAGQAATNMGYGNFANGLSMDTAYANMAGFNQELGTFNGGGLLVTSSSPIAASGVTVQSENLVVEGPLAVTGHLPFLGVVELEGPLTATGQGNVAYGCGNGNTGMIEENLAGAPGPLMGGITGMNARNPSFRMPGVGPGLF